MIASLSTDDVQNILIAVLGVLVAILSLLR